MSKTRARIGYERQAAESCRGSGDGMLTRGNKTQHGRPTSVEGPSGPISDEGLPTGRPRGTGRAEVGVGQAHSTEEAGNDRGGKGPELKGQRRKQRGRKGSDDESGTPSRNFRSCGRRCTPKPRQSGVLPPAVCERVNLLREPDAGDPHVRFDERDVETEHGTAREAPANERAGKRIGRT